MSLIRTAHASLALLVATSVAALIHTGDARRPSRPLEDALPGITGAQRFFEPRLSGGFTYAPLTTRTRGVSMPPARSPEMLLALATAERAARANQSPTHMAAWGRALLLMGDSGTAISVLAQAINADPSNSSWKSDLAAAYLVRAEASDRQEDRIRGLDAALAARRRAPELREAHFNVALALAANYLPDAAAAEWRAYASTDPSSGWGNEARQRLGASAHLRERWPVLQAQLKDGEPDAHAVKEAVETFPQDVRELVENELLPAWAQARERDDRMTAAKWLSRSFDLAMALDRSGADRMLVDIVRSVQQSQDDPRAASTLVPGLVGFARARELLIRPDYKAAAEAFDHAYRQLEAAHNPLAKWALTHRAYAEYEQHRIADAVRAVTAVASYADEHSYDALRARALWIHALAARDEGMHDRALQFSEQAMGLFERVRERAQAGAVASTAADLARTIGYRRRSWDLLSGGLEALETETSPGRRYRGYYNASLFARRDGLFEAALAFQNEALREAQQRRSSVAQAYAQRAAILSRLGESAAALQDLDSGRQALSLDSDSTRAYLDAELQTVHASIVLSSEPARARELLLPTLGFFERASPEVVPEIHLALGRAALAVHQTAEALEEFSRGIEYFERQRLRIGDEELRIAFFGTSGDLYREMVRLKLDAGEPEEAFAYSERSRGRALLDAMPAPRSPVALGLAPRPALFGAAVPNGAAFLEFFLLDREIVSWVVTARGLAWRRVSITSAEVERLNEEIRGGAEAGQRAASALYDAFIGPVREELKETPTLVISADGLLNRVPFAALVDARTRRPLVEDFSVTYTPSAAWWIAEQHRSGPPAVPTSVLSIGNPRIDQTASLALPPLPDAEREAHAVAALYSRSTVLTGRDATRPRFLAGAREVDVVHFAGHAVANVEFPHLSYLLLAPSGGDDGRLRSMDIDRLAWRRTQLVVLAACGTAEGAMEFGEGVMHLARPFMAAGVPAVVATLWDVEDRGTGRLLTRFHTNLMSGISAAEALRLAQLAMIRSSDPQDRKVGQWAPFVLIGAPGRSGRHTEGRLQ